MKVVPDKDNTKPIGRTLMPESEKVVRRPNRSEMFGLPTNAEVFNSGKPFEDLNENGKSTQHIVYISQEEEVNAENAAVQNEVGQDNMTDGRGFGGLPAQDGHLQFYQQQLMLNQQMMLQQQQTVNSLIGKIDTLSKFVHKESTDPISTTGSENVKLSTINRKRESHVLSDSSVEDVSSDSEFYSDSDGSVDDRKSTKSNGSSKIIRLEQKETSEGAKDSENVSSNMLLLQEMGKEFEKTEAVDKKVNDTLAKVVNSGIRAQIDRNAAKDMCSKYQRPENCEALKVPKINKELWNTSSLVKSSKERDKNFQTAQKYLNQGMIPLVQLMDKLLKSEESEEFKLARDAFQLLAYAHRDISNLRRQLIKSVVSEKYKQLCNDSTPLTENLLGDELEKQIKTMDEMRKVGKDLTSAKADKADKEKHQNSRSAKYNKTHNQYKDKYRYEYAGKSFLDRRGRRQQSAHNKKQSHKKQSKQ